MKTFGNKSWTAIIALLINIIWWGEWLWIIYTIAGIFEAAYYRGGYAPHVPIAFNQATIAAPIKSFYAPLNITHLNCTSGDLYFNVDATWQSISVLVGFYIVVFTGIAIITYQVKVIFSNFSKNLPFNAVNIPRIKNIAYVFIAYSVLQWASTIVIREVLVRIVHWRKFELIYDFDFKYFIFGIVLFIVAEIFKIGAALEEERNLTI
jgi:hypothetical protein